MDNKLRDSALEYHAKAPAGKLSILPTKQLTNQYDLSLAYSPGVAAVCQAIVDDPKNAEKYTSRGNLVAVITNGTAVLGLGAIGPLAAKPVMEGKAVLFKKFADIDVFDLEVDARDPQQFIDVVRALEPSFGAINLEDVKAPECFVVERELQRQMKIPVFHDDQHGTAIIVSAAVMNGLRLQGKKIEDAKLVASGAGAAALACIGLLEKVGLQRRNITVTDIKGVVYKGRTEEMDEYKSVYAIDTKARTLDDVMAGADIFLGLSAGGVLKADMVKKMAPNPLVLALANPTPEILPPEVKAVRPDAIVATGRSDYANQVNNVLCFPYIFRGALDVGATCINEEMRIAAVHAIANLTTESIDSRLDDAYMGEVFSFGPDYIIPKPFDPRLIVRIAPAVAKAAMDSGVATRPMEDFEAYTQKLNNFTLRTGAVMKPIFAAARRTQEHNRIVFCEGEHEPILRAVQVVVDEDIARPILIGRPEVVQKRIERFNLKIRAGVDFELVNPNDDSRYNTYWQHYYSLMQRRGVTQEQAKQDVIRHPSLIGTLMVQLGDADGSICGTVGRFRRHLESISPVLGMKPGVKTRAALNLVILPKHNLFLCDPYVNFDPSAEQIAEITQLAADEVRLFGIVPRVALLSHSNYGSYDTPSAIKMREALRIIRERNPELMVDGEMQADYALSEDARKKAFPFSPLQGSANLLIFPNVEAANIAFNLLKTTGGEGVTIGPILLGCPLPVHILTSAASVRRIVNMTAITVASANRYHAKKGRES
jgi:malate dehydrogenase (oxaloacetate-decarboxylating)(NADP+)